MSKYGIRESSLLLKEAEEAVASIGTGASNVDGWLSHLHQRLNDCVDTLYSKQRPCCPQFMKKLKTHRATIKRWLENQKNSSPALI